MRFALQSLSSLGGLFVLALGLVGIWAIDRYHRHFGDGEREHWDSN